MTHKDCMNTSCTSRKEATLAFRVSFVFNRNGFPPKTHEAWVGVYVCDDCATQDAADEIMRSTWELGLMIGTAINAGSLDRKQTSYEWAPMEGAIKFLSRVEAQQAKEAAARRVSIVDAANDPGNLQ